MRSLVSAVVFATAVSPVAYADGIPQRYKEQVCCAPFSWTGVYIGGHSGWGSMELVVPPGTAGVPSPTGGFWGGQVGANYQFARNWVVGAEIDSSFARIEDTKTVPEPFDAHTLISGTVKLNSLTTLRGRLGFAWDRTLLYVTGGWAWSEVEVTTANSNNGGVLPVRIVTDHVTAPGWTVGGGLEMSLWSNWTGKIEYQLVHSDTITFKTVGTHVDSIGETGPPVRFDLQTIRIGVNYLFH
jgi:outer membrane immunogenic protein